MNPKGLLVRLFMLALSVIFVAAWAWAAPGPLRDEGAIKPLVADTTWHISPVTGAGFEMFWNWGRDGTLCFRSQGFRAGDPCTDTGNWRIESDKLCWKLSWYGETTGINAACVHLVDSGAGHYEAVAAQGSNLWHPKFEFTLSTN